MSNLRTGDVIITNKLSHTNDWVLYGVVGTVQQHGVMKYLCVKRYRNWIFCRLQSKSFTYSCRCGIYHW